MPTRTERLGLRERKKRRTRQTILSVAIRLFEERGYAETTLVQIADAAEIAPSTFFNYFPSKVDIVFGLLDAILESARERLIGRPAGETASEALLDWVRDDLGAVERPYAEVLRTIPKIVASVPELRAEQRLRWALLEDVFAEAFSHDLGESTPSVRAHVMASIAFRGMVDVWEAWHQQHADDATVDIAEVLALKADYVENALSAGLAAVELLPLASSHPRRLMVT